METNFEKMLNKIRNPRHREWVKETFEDTTACLGLGRDATVEQYARSVIQTLCLCMTEDVHDYVRGNLKKELLLDYTDKAMAIVIDLSR